MSKVRQGPVWGRKPAFRSSLTILCIQALLVCHRGIFIFDSRFRNNKRKKSENIEDADSLKVCRTSCVVDCKAFRATGQMIRVIVAAVRRDSGQLGEPSCCGAEPCHMFDL